MKRNGAFHVVKWSLIVGLSLMLALVTFLGVAAFRLSQGPVSLNFIVPYIEAAFAGPSGRNTVDLHNVVLTWNGWQEPLEVQVVNLHVVTGDDVVELVAPKTSIGLSFRALLLGRISLSWAKFTDPVLSVTVDLKQAEGSDTPEKTDETAVTEKISLDRLVATARKGKKALFAEFDDYLGNDLLRYLSTTQIRNGRLLIHDQGSGMVWEGRSFYSRAFYTKRNVSTYSSAVFGVRDGAMAAMSVASTLDGVARTLSLDIDIDNVHPTEMVLASVMDEFRAFDMPFDIRLRGFLTERNQDERLAVVLSGGKGSVSLKPLTGDDAVYPVTSLYASASASGKPLRVSLDRLSVDLGGPELELTVEAEKKENTVVLKADAVLQMVEAESLKRYWPESMAVNPRTWITANIEKGLVKEATAHLAGTFDPVAPQPLQIDALHGTIVVEDASVSYIKSMTPAEGVYADIVYDQNTMNITSTKGRRGNLTLKGGKIVLSGLSGREQFADIAITTVGELSDGLAAIDEEPLRYATKFGIDPRQARGEAVVDLKIARMPLLSGLKVEDIDVQATVAVRNGGLSKIAAGMDVTQANAELKIDVTGMDIEGTGVIKKIPVAVKGRESFVSGGEFDRRYQLKATLNDEQRRELGLETQYTVAPYLSGPVTVDATLSTKGKTARIALDADLKGAMLAVPELAWRKRRDVEATGSVALVMNGTQLSQIPQFSLSGAGLVTKGSASFAKGSLQRLSFDALRIGKRTDLQGSIAFRADGGLTIAVKGKSLDVSSLLESSETTGTKSPGKKEDAARKPLPPMTVSASLDQLWLTPDGKIDNLAVAVKRENQNWQSVQITGAVDREPVSFSIQPAEKGKRNFFGATKNIGALLYAATGVRRISGGDAVLSGTIDDTRKAQTSEGILVVKNYRVTNAPLLARILTVATLTGILDALNGQGISFSELSAPFILEDGLLTLKEARTAGTSLGLTAKGQIDLDHGNLAIEGTIAPAYIVNGLLDGVPILGDILVFEKGGGVFASLYSVKGPISDPQVGVNPLSTLTPGILRQLFNIFDDGSGTQARPPSE